MIGYGIDPSHVGALAQDLQERRIAALLSENKKEKFSFTLFAERFK